MRLFVAFNEIESPGQVFDSNGRGAINADGSGHDGPKPKLTKKETDFISMIEVF